MIIQLSGNYTGYADSFILKDMEKLAKYVTGEEVSAYGRDVIAGTEIVFHDFTVCYMLPFQTTVKLFVVMISQLILKQEEMESITQYEGRREAGRWATGVHESFLDMINVNETININ